MAETRAGCLYVWGVTGPDAFDCSGLVQWSLAQLGISFPRVSEAQYNACQPISLEQAWVTPGAILWFEGHIGISCGDNSTSFEVFEWDGSEYEILQILNFKKLEICTSLYKFIESPSINYYTNLISERYYTVAENIAYVLSDKISKSRPEEIAMSFFTSLIYYPIDE